GGRGRQAYRAPGQRDLGGVARAGQIAGVRGGDSLSGKAAPQILGLSSSVVAQRHVLVALVAAALVPRRDAVAGHDDANHRVAQGSYTASPLGAARPNASRASATTYREPVTTTRPPGPAWACAIASPAATDRAPR